MKEKMKQTHHDHNDTHHTTQHTTPHGERDRDRDTVLEPHARDLGHGGEDHRLHRCAVVQGMLLRSGVGRFKHLTTKQLWVQSAVASYGVVIEKIPRAVNSADAFSHSLSGQALMDHLRRLGFRYI